MNLHTVPYPPSLQSKNVPVNPPKILLGLQITEHWDDQQAVEHFKIEE